MTPVSQMGACNSDPEKVRLLKYGRHGGIVIEKQLYQLVVMEMLSILLSQGELSLNDFLSKVKMENAAYRGDANWLLLQVKQDLMVRGLVKCNFKTRRNQSIELVMGAFLKSDFGKPFSSIKRFKKEYVESTYGVSAF